MSLSPPPRDLARLVSATGETFTRRTASIDAFLESSTRHLVTVRAGEAPVHVETAAHGLLLRCVHARGRASVATSDLAPEGVRYALRRAGLAVPRARFTLTPARIPTPPIRPWIAHARDLAARLVAAGARGVEVIFDVTVRHRFVCGDGARLAPRAAHSSFATLEASAASRSPGPAHAFTSVDFADAGAFALDPLVRRMLARVRQRAPKPSPRGRTTILLAPGVSGIVFHELVGHPLEADSALAGVSPLAPRLGRRVAPAFLTVRDLPRGEGAVDDEGNPEIPVTLLDRGKPSGLLHDRLTSAALGAPASGNGRSAGWADEPIPRMRTLAVDAGPADPSALLADVREGIYVERITEGVADLSTGRFTVPLAQGRRIIRGKLGETVNGGRLVGDTLTALRRIRGVGNDVRGCPEPVMCIKGVVVDTAARGPTVLLGELGIE